MYRCKECKAEYKNKVEYCDCGNNTFDYIEDKIQPTSNKNNKSLSLEEKSELVSRIFFAICILISVIVWLIPVKSNVKPKTQQKTKPPVIKNIPDIDSIWNDTPSYKPQTTNNINEEAPISIASNYTNSNYPIQNNTSQPQNNTVKKNSLKPSVTKTPEYEIVYNAPPTSKKKEVKQEQSTATHKPKPTYNPNSPAMLKYKGDLRAALFSKFAAGSIPGSGSCEIEFSIDKTGKLINRKFSRESDNKTLNDVVYYMLMSVPKFTPPPNEYNGQKIRMKFVINNGSYEITIN